ncbi:MAG: hypothetical protein IPI64_02870 [Chloracidobacterium sp.]|nr:hypothetical protein [Chloracidobacterium sp.]
MSGKLEVSFNSPQCGWMSIGFDDGVSEFHTTTAHAPHESALPELMQILTDLTTESPAPRERTLKWNRDPEEFDFRFVREGDKMLLQIYQYPTDDRSFAERELVFTHLDIAGNVIDAFLVTFDQLYADRETDEFEFNWRAAFPFAEYEEFKKRMI